jgi:transcriptional regulator with XRE-family HTH domain
VTRTRLQLEADRRTALIRSRLAEDLQRLRADAGVSQVAIARHAGLDRSVISKLEAGTLAPTLETYQRIAAALGADFTARVYPNTGPTVRDRHSIRMADVVIGHAHQRWRISPEVGVRRPAKGWIDLALHDPDARIVVATELESDLRRVEQVIRWSTEKAASIASSDLARRWVDDGVEMPMVSRLLVVRHTRSNVAAVEDARRLLRQAFPADPNDAIRSLTGVAPWPGPALIWARIDRGRAALHA